MRRYTLTELMVAVGALSVLLTLLALALRSSTSCGPHSHGKARSDLLTLKLAIEAYRVDTGHYPRPRYDRSAPQRALRDAGPALYAALLHAPSLGGGPNRPYVEYREVGVLLDRSVLAADRMGSDGVSGVRPLTEREREQRRALGADAGNPLVFLDPWGNPYHYREWASVAPPFRADWRKSPPLRTRFSSPRPLETTLIKLTQDLPHTDTFDIWSNGPNGVNEYGDPFSDDIVSWRD